MKIPSIISTNSIKLLSGLGNNDDCLAAMIAKDWIGDAATVYTYKKEGGKDDAREKAIEEFGTGAIWLFGIPAVKKLIEKTVYPLLKLDSNFDPRILDNKDRLKQITDTLAASNEEAVKSQQQVFKNLFEKNSVLKKFTNADLYKGLAVGKFLVATVASAFALNGIIKYKQKTTTQRIEKELENQKTDNTSSLVVKSVEKNPSYLPFTKANKQNNHPSFTGGLAEFMYNPIKNTMILDGVITGTRMKNAREGEKGEVLFKEICQIAVIYLFPKLFDKTVNAIGKKINCPTELDPKILFDNNLKAKLEGIDADTFKKIVESKDILSTLQGLGVENKIIDLLDKNGTIATIKDKSGNIKSLDYFKPVDDDAVKNVAKNIELLKNNFNNLSKTKAFKTTAIIANVLAGALLMGVAQPLVNIAIRKIKNNGDNRNPAIIEQEKKAKQQLVNA